MDDPSEYGRWEDCGLYWAWRSSFQCLPHERRYHEPPYAIPLVYSCTRGHWIRLTGLIECCHQQER